jgi:hypothetical protein
MGSYQRSRGKYCFHFHFYSENISKNLDVNVTIITTGVFFCVGKFRPNLETVQKSDAFSIRDKTNHSSPSNAQV